MTRCSAKWEANFPAGSASASTSPARFSAQTPILILDEATSQVDAESEHLIQQAIESIMHERTTFVIAHRFSTILSADTIVVMERGQIIGQGEHDELLGDCPTYRQLYERQLIGV